MDFLILVSNRWNGGWVAFGRWLGGLFQRKFHLYVAVLFTLFAIADTAVFHVTEDVAQDVFDTILHYRLVKPRPDPDIVILDINEASLAAMAGEYGRWPWPRQVFGEFLELVRKQEPKAIVFDILFSDPDLYNADSDAYFDSAIAAASDTFFPLLRLSPANDGLSQVRMSMLPGVEPPPQGVGSDPAVAVVLPHFPAALAGNRLGTHNIEADGDAIVRKYSVYRDEQGWKLPSLPARIAREFGWPVPEEKNVLLNWRGEPFTYRYVNFSDVFLDMISREKRRPANEFRGKILIIGSTAPSLFDFKPTPMSHLHPGVEILATAIDNFKHGDFLRFPKAAIPYLLLSLAIIWVTAWKFYSAVNPIILDWWFGLSQMCLVTVSYVSINVSNVYINLTAPVSFALTFFGITRFYGSITRKWLERSMARLSMRQAGERQATMLLIRLDTHDISDIGWENIRVGLLRAGREEKSVEVLDGDPKGFWDLLEKTFVVSWMAPVEDATARARLTADAEAVLAAFPGLMRRELVDVDGVASWFYHHGTVTCGEAAEESWRLLFAETLIQWNISKYGKEKK